MSSIRSSRFDVTHTHGKVLCGYLIKQIPLLSKRRWCVLKGKTLYIFKSHQEKIPMESIDISSSSFESLEQQTGKFIFSLKLPSESWKPNLFQVDFQETFQMWTETLAQLARPPPAKKFSTDETSFWGFRSSAPTFTFLTPDSIDNYHQEKWDLSCLVETASKQGGLIAAGNSIVKHWKMRWVAVNGLWILQLKHKKGDFISVAVPLELAQKDDIEILSDADASALQLPVSLPQGAGESSTSTVILRSVKLFWFSVKSIIVGRSFFFGATSASDRSEWVTYLRDLVNRSAIQFSGDFEIQSVQTVECKPDSSADTPSSNLSPRSKLKISSSGVVKEDRKGSGSGKGKIKPLYRYSTMSSASSYDSHMDDNIISPPAIVSFDALETIQESSDNPNQNRDSQRFSFGHNISLSDIDLQEKIGRGASGKVYSGVYRGQTVAVKKLFLKKMTKKDLQNFYLEVELCMKLTHPNIIKLIGSSREPPNLMLIMEFVPRGNLSSMLYDLSQPFSWDLRLKMLHQTASAMEYVHSQNILHRDLKSANLLVSDEFDIKISDFGVARYFCDDDAPMTQIGSPCWMAPEVIRNEVYGPPADVFSFAIVIWEFNYRRLPYDGMNGMQISYKVVMENMRPSVPPAPLAATLVDAEANIDGIDENEPVHLPDSIAIEASLSATDSSQADVGGKRQTSSLSALFQPHTPSGSRKKIHAKALEPGSQELLDLMKSCWTENTSERPNFGQIASSLLDITRGFVLP